jgi:putative flavoprotein involved in K+ transport
MHVDDGRGLFSGGLAHLVASADLKQLRLLQRIDEFAVDRDLGRALLAPQRPCATVLGAVPTEIDLARFETVVWATGYRPRFDWLDPIAFDCRNRITHDGGICALPGLYLLGLPFMRRRKSSFIDGVGPDAAELASHLHAHLDRRTHA